MNIIYSTERPYVVKVNRWLKLQLQLQYSTVHMNTHHADVCWSKSTLTTSQGPTNPPVARAEFNFICSSKML